MFLCKLKCNETPFCRIFYILFKCTSAERTGARHEGSTVQNPAHRKAEWVSARRLRNAAHNRRIIITGPVIGIYTCKHM